MKITYIKPEVDIIELSTETTLLAGSDPTYDNKGDITNDFEQGAKKNDFDMFDFDEE